MEHMVVRAVEGSDCERQGDLRASQQGRRQLQARRDYRAPSGGVVAVGDLNKDRKLDLATGAGGFVSVLLDRSDGSFGPGAPTEWETTLTRSPSVT
jgi:hypothetical protein